MDYYDEIHQRAVKSFSYEFVPDNYDKWCDHWFVTAEALRDEFAAEGLTVTAAHVQSLIDTQRRYK